MLSREHFGVTWRLTTRFRTTPATDFLHLALVGQGGTGKSTLVRQAMQDQKDIGILPIYVNASETFDRADIHFADVILVLVEAVVRLLVDEHDTIELDPEHLERVRRWFAEEVLSEDERRQIIGSVESGAELRGGVPGLVQLASSARGTLRSENEYRKQIRMKAARNPEGLLAGANALLNAVHEALAARKQRICVVFDNLEKIQDRSQVNKAFLSRAEDLRRLRCHAIYFLHPADQYSPVQVQANQAFTYVDVPAIPIRQFASDAFEHVHVQALGAITKLLERRLDTIKLFEDSDVCIRALARWSGGRLRDLIELTSQACESALAFGRSQVDIAAIEHAARKLATLRLTAMTPECWPRAREIHRDHVISNREADALMLRNGLVLAYDGQPWWDIHPFIAADPRFVVTA